MIQRNATAALVAAFAGGTWFTQCAPSQPGPRRSTLARRSTVGSLAQLKRRLAAVEAVRSDTSGRQLGALATRVSAIESSVAAINATAEDNAGDDDADNAAANDATAAAAAVHDVHDVIIIGGGIVGASLALQLGLRAREVGQPLRMALLEAGGLGSGASGLSAGTIWAAGLGDGSSARARVCDETLLMLRHVEALGFECELEECGALQLACTPAEVELLRGSAAAQLAHGYDVALVEGAAAVAELEPALRGGTALAALHSPRSAHVEPMAATVAIAEAALAVGGGARLWWDVRGDKVVRLSVAEHARVQGVRKQAQAQAQAQAQVQAQVQAQAQEGQLLWEVTVAGQQQPMLAKHVVLAAGTACAELGRGAGVDIPVTPCKGMIWAASAPDDDGADEAAAGVGAAPAPAGGAPPLSKIIFIAESHLGFARLEEEERRTGVGAGLPHGVTHDVGGQRRLRHAYGRPRRDGSVIFGGSRIPLAPGADEARACVLGEAELLEVASNQAHVAEFFPAARALESAGAWCGVMPFSQDGPPLVGSLAPLGGGGGGGGSGGGGDLAGLWLAAGFGPHGIMEGPGAMKFLAEDIVDSLRGYCALKDSEAGRYRAEVLAAYDPCRGAGAKAAAAQ
jgi:glycine/D-amino acid oxidase-like deaminating enzyme